MQSEEVRAILEEDKDKVKGVIAIVLQAIKRARTDTTKIKWKDALIHFLRNNITSDECAVLLENFEKGLSELDGFHLNLLGNIFYDVGLLDKAEEYYIKAIDCTNSYRYKSNLATLYSLESRYEESLELYRDSLSNDISESNDRNRILYNFCYCLQLSGQYEESKKCGNDLIIRYEKLKEIKKEDASFWKDYGDHLALNFGNYEESIEKYETGLVAVESDECISLLIALITSNMKLAESFSNTKIQKSAKAKRSAKKYRVLALQLLKDKEFRDIEKEAEIEFASGNFDVAIDLFIRLTENGYKYIAHEKADIDYFVGLCYYKLEKFDKSIEFLKKSRSNNPAPFVSNLLAQAYRMTKDFVNAELLFMEVEQTAPYNTNTIYGQIFLYMDWADNLISTSKDRAKDYYILSITKASKLIEENGMAKYFRSLSREENCELYFVQGYGCVQLSKISSSYNKREYLTRALELFEHVRGESAYFFKSQRAKIIVGDNIKEGEQAIWKVQKKLVQCGLVLALFSMFVFLGGKPIIDLGYKVDTKLLAKKLALSDSVVYEIFRDKRFESIQSLEDYVNEYYLCEIEEIGSVDVRASDSSYINISLKPVDSTALITLLFVMSLGLILLGYLWGQIKKIKIGEAIEIEKGDQTMLVKQAELTIIR